MTNEVNTILMLDIESLDLGPRSALLQIGGIAAPSDDLNKIARKIDHRLPIDPQLALGRTIGFDTVAWWLDQDEKAKEVLVDSTGNDMDYLTSSVRAVHRRISEIVSQAGGKKNVEIWAKGPQFDIVNIESLFADCGLEAPWSYDMVRDLRTLQAFAGVSTNDVSTEGLRPHVAIDDCRIQMRVYQKCLQMLGAL